MPKLVISTGISVPISSLIMRTTGSSPPKVKYLYTVAKGMGSVAFLTVWLQKVLLTPMKREHVEMVRQRHNSG